MPSRTGDTRSQTTDEIDSGKSPAAIECFAEFAEVPQSPHVEGDVEQASVKEYVGQQAPPFSRESQCAYVGSPVHQFATGKIHDGGTGERHPEEHGSIDAEDYLGEADGGFTAADPGSAHDWLRRIADDFAALRGFVLNAPLADLLAEGETGKLAATSNAVCHDYP